MSNKFGFFHRTNKISWFCRYNNNDSNNNNNSNNNDNDNKFKVGYKQATISFRYASIIVPYGDWDG